MTNDALVSKKQEDIKPILKNSLSDFRTAYDSKYIIEQADKLFAKEGLNSEGYMPISKIYQALTLREFDQGILLIEAFREELKTFVIDLSKQIQQEYGCTTASQKATAELAASSYARTLQNQMMITRYLNRGEFTDIGVGYLNFLSKEIDRANRHYLTAIQTLISFRQPPMNITVKTNTANIAHQQVIQENINVKPK